VKPVSLPHTRYGIATYYIVATAEASSNLARFDGVRFGLRVESPKSDLTSLYGKTRNAGFGAEVKRRILLGTYVLSAGYYDAYYKKALRVRTLIKRDFDQAFEQVERDHRATSQRRRFDSVKRSIIAGYVPGRRLHATGELGRHRRPERAGARRRRGWRATVTARRLQLLGPAFAEERLFSLAAESNGAWARCRDRRLSEEICPSCTVSAPRAGTPNAYSRCSKARAAVASATTGTSKATRMLGSSAATSNPKRIARRWSRDFWGPSCVASLRSMVTPFAAG